MSILHHGIPSTQILEPHNYDMDAVDRYQRLAHLSEPRGNTALNLFAIRLSWLQTSWHVQDPSQQD